MAASIARRRTLGAALLTPALLAPVSLAPAFLLGARRPAWAADALTALERRSDGRIGLAAIDLANGRRLVHRAAERFAFCSTFKLIAAGAILKRAERERHLLERHIAYTRADLVAYSPITAPTVDAGMTLGAICAAALQHSDNTAGNLMIRTLGGVAQVTAFARSLGDGAFRLDRMETALNEATPGDPRDTTTPAAMAHDLHALTLGAALAAGGRAQLVDWMKGCATGAGRIRAAVPRDWDVADKTGAGGYGTTNDIAVLFPPGRAPIVLAIYFRQFQRTAPYRDAVVAEAARIALARLIPG
ncbi:MAG: class A beta-lactamase [Rhodospirillales bacterium]|nr:class A beta-lactamase [Rhodospirillales bacterium]